MGFMKVMTPLLGSLVTIFQDVVARRIIDLLG